MSRGFDRVAPYYDRLARLVFGHAIAYAQTCFLTAIPEASTILVLGGGTGWIIPAMQQAVSNGRIWYVEASANMLEKAKNNCRQDPRVHFIHGTEQNLPSGVRFDVVITNFYLDLFSTGTLKSRLEIIGRSLNPDPVWLVSDFVGGRWWQRLLLWIMYRFFRMVCNIEADTLPLWETAMRQAGFRYVAGRSYYKGFIKSVVYARAGIERGAGGPWPDHPFTQPLSRDPSTS